MPVPFLIFALLGLGGFGFFKFGQARRHNADAVRMLDDAKRTHEAACGRLEAARGRAAETLEALGRLKLAVWEGDLGRFVALFDRIRNVPVEGSAVEGSASVGRLGAHALTEHDLAEMRQLSSFASQALAGSGPAVTTGFLIGVSSYGGAMLFASASTGTAIATLSGVAATNATLAWFGGGSLAVGGFGVAGGTVVLGGVFLAPAVAVAGHLMAVQAEANLASAREDGARAMSAVAEIDAVVVILQGVTEIALQFHEVVEQLVHASRLELDALESVIESAGIDYASYPVEDRELVHRAVTFAHTLKMVLEAPILTASGDVAMEYDLPLQSARRLLGAA